MMNQEDSETPNQNNGNNDAEAQLQRLSNINKKYEKWAEDLKEQDRQISNIEAQIEVKESMLKSVDKSLQIIEDRQNRFEKLLSLYEEQIGNGKPIYTRFEILDKAKSLSRNLSSHQEEIQNMDGNIKYLRDMIYLISDAHCKFSKLKKMFSPNQEIIEDEFIDENDF